MNRTQPLVLSLALLCSATPAPAAPAEAPAAATDRPAARLGDDAVPTSESVRLRLDPDKPDYSGAVRVELSVRKPTDRLRLHGTQRIERVTLSGPGGPVAATPEQSGAELTLRTARPLQPGRYTLALSFHAQLGTRAVGLYRMVQDGRGYVFTQFEPADARHAFPCWDEPGFKLPYQLTVEVPAGQEAVSNTPIESDRTSGGLRTIAFRRTRPLPSYLLALAVGPLESVPIPGLSVPGRVVTPRGQKHLAARAVEMTPPILKALEAYFGGRYPYEKLDLIAVPEYWPGAMENPGAITYSDKLLLLDPKGESAAQRRLLATITAHELAHMWFGDLVTMAWWDDLWLNESFADWMASKIVRQVYPQYRADMVDAQATQHILLSDARPASEAIRRPITNPDQGLSSVYIHYLKGRAVLSMFERWLGADKLRAGVLAYLRAHADGNARSEDLWAALRESTGQDVAPAMGTFLDQPGFPLIDVEPLQGGRVRLTQRRFVNAGVKAPEQRWRVPVALRYGDGAGAHERTVLLDGPRLDVDLGGAVSWVFPQADGVGYYRFRMPEARLLELARQAPKLLGPAERVALVGDLPALVEAGALHGDALLRLLRQLADDPDPQVVGAVVGALDRVEKALVTTELRPAFAAYVRELLGPARARFGLTRRAGEPEAAALLRPQLVRWLGDRGEDPEVRKMAREGAAAYLKDPESVDPALAETYLVVAARAGDQALFDAYRRRLEATKVPAERGHLLGALGAFRDERLAQEALRYALSGPVRPTEIFETSEEMHDRPEGRERVYKWLTANYGAVTGRIPPEFVAKMPNFAGGCEEDRLAAARRFFTEPAHHVDGTDLELAKVEQSVRDCAALRRREGQAAARYLKTPR